MDSKQLKEWADLMGVSIEEAKKLRKKGIAERKKHNKFQSKKSEAKFVETGKNEVIENMTFKEWIKNKK